MNGNMGQGNQLRRLKMNNVYGVLAFQPTLKQIKLREQKIKEAIEYLGDKYLLAKPVERTNAH